MNDEEFDVLNLVKHSYPDLTIHIGGGFVRLMDVMPRLVQHGRTPEIAIVKSARVSLGKNVGDIERDTKLINYLVKNNHTSPLESVEFQFCIKAPRFVIQQLLRHRTANVNEFSQRYAEIPLDEVAYWYPSELRLQSSINKQLGNTPSNNEELTKLVDDTNKLLDQVVENYHQMNRLGMAREIARYCLPVSTFSTLYFKLDLNNLIKFFRLRTDYTHAQKETADVAVAMMNLISSLVPNVLKASGLIL